MARGIELKTNAQFAAMRRAGLVVSDGLIAMAAAAVPGATTAQIAEVGRGVLESHGARSSFLNYGAAFGCPPYPSVVCLSPDDVVVHGIPGPRVLEDGDILSIDFGAIMPGPGGRGWHGDAARTVAVGDVTDEVRRLIDVTRQSMWDGIAAIQVGARVGDVSAAVEASVKSHGVRYGIVREYTGHGIGSAMHQSPDVPNWGRPHKGARIERGMALCVEPMITLGGERMVEQADGWTVKTADGSWAAHWENTVAVTKEGLWVLTEPDGGQRELQSRGIRCAAQS